MAWLDHVIEDLNLSYTQLFKAWTYVYKVWKTNKSVVASQHCSLIKGRNLEIPNEFKEFGAIFWKSKYMEY